MQKVQKELSCDKAATKQINSINHSAFWGHGEIADGQN